MLVNNEGTEIYAIKNLREKYNRNFWTLETIFTGL